MIRLFKKNIERLKAYIYNPTVSLKNKSFVLFSLTVLVALFAAIPCGMIMHEPPMSTISTLVGAVAFSIYVLICIKFHRIDRARIAISLILVFAFLPGMFFTNGGVYGGTPIWLLLGTIYISMILEGRMKYIMLLLNMIIMIMCWIVGYLKPELVVEYSRGGNFYDSIAALIIVSIIVYVLITFQINLLRRDEEDKSLRKLFEQTATALVNAIDAKDQYTHGHSSRVAEYSNKIGEKYGLSPRECNDLYYVALLHDVGKIGIPEEIINKPGKLTDEEYEIIKQHPVLGAKILEGITEIPFISEGAKYHHERYDGKGYPDKLIGTDIPLFARIISVADSYDAMTSIRSYRDPIPQQKVREEFVKGIGTQFDPVFARIMIQLIDADIEYEMKEHKEIKELAGKDEIVSKAYRSEYSEGIYLTPNMVSINVRISKANPDVNSTAKPVFVLFDSLDAHVYDDSSIGKDLNYFEYGEIGFDGQTITSGARKMQTDKTVNDTPQTPAKDVYKIDGVRIGDHALIRITGYEETNTIIVALPDSARFAYLALTGENCIISDVSIDRSEEKTAEDYIPRIAERVSYIDVPAGDVPNIQVDGYRTCATKGVPVKNGMEITFHTMSLPTARLVWHTAFVNIFTSDDANVFGENYHDYMLMRLDGECWEADPACKAKVYANSTEDFEGWDAWKQLNKQGFNCTVRLEKMGNTVTVRTENSGIVLKNTAVISDNPKIIYVALSGDQVAITNIRYHYK